MKLEMKLLAPYLPYGLKIFRDGKIMELCGLSSPYKTNDNYFVRGETKVVNGTYRQTCSFMIDDKHADTFKPILRPMSDFWDASQSWMHQVRDIDNSIEFWSGEFDNPCHLPYVCFELLIRNHFDVFDLLTQNLAISIHDLEK